MKQKRGTNKMITTDKIEKMERKLRDAEADDKKQNPATLQIGNRTFEERPITNIIEKGDKDYNIRRNLLQK